jgi:hypothetical protein
MKFALGLEWRECIHGAERYGLHRMMKTKKAWILVQSYLRDTL